MEQTPNTPHMDEQEPFIPPYIMLILAAIGLVIAGLVAFTQAEFTLIGWGGLGLALIALIAWGFMAPEQARAALTGRTARFGGTTLVVTVIFLAALVAIYAVVPDNWRWDLTQREEFSLTEAARDEIRKLGADPTRPQVKIIAFYGVSQAGQRDRNTVLFDDYVQASNSKISYEFIDLDRYKTLAEKYGNAKNGDVKVFKVQDDGELDVENAETVSPVNQEELTNAILRVSSSGDFRAYFLTVDGGLQLEDNGQDGLAALNDNLKRLKWTTRQVTLFELTSPESEAKLTGTGADGAVLVIPGGTAPLPDEQLKVITDFVDQGGDLVILAAATSEGDSLATAPNLSTYLWDNFGLRVKNDIVVDPTASSQSPLTPLAADFDRSHFITSALNRGGAMLFDVTHTIEVAETPPASVTVTPLVKSTAGAFAKTDFSGFDSGEYNRAEGDAQGPFVLAAAAENADTGGRVVVFGSQYVATNRYEILSALGIENLTAVFRGIAWATNYDEFVTDIPQIGFEFRPQDTPIFANDQELRTINLVTIILLPFGILGAGLWVWWRSRERETAH